VVAALTALPPQKIHCSILALDALGEAIYNYYLQEGMKVPAELAKRHQQITTEQEMIKKRYEAWVKESRAMLEDESTV
jgi:hypothetical protein